MKDPHMPNLKSLASIVTEYLSSLQSLFVSVFWPLILKLKYVKMGKPDINHVMGCRYCFLNIELSRNAENWFDLN